MQKTARRLRGLLRLAGWTLLGVWFVFAATVLVLRYWVLPDAARYRPDLEAVVSKAIGLPVRIGGLQAGWAGLRPELTLTDVQVANRKGQTVLAFVQVDAVLAWTTSLFSFEPRLYRLVLDSPALHIERLPDGQILVAGIPIAEDTNREGSAADWVLQQHQVLIRNALVVWEDHQRAAPALNLERLNLRLENFGPWHRFGLTGTPPSQLAGPLDLRGDLRGRSLKDRGGWKGELFLQADQVDLAGWRSWFDYPVELPRGHGGLRAWVDVEAGQPVGATADLALGDLQLRLAPGLPMIELERLQGRLQARHDSKGYALASRGLNLATRDGIAVPSTNADLAWSVQGDGRTSGQGTVSTLDLAVFSRLAALLPLDAATRQLLVDYAPEGRLDDARVTWLGSAERLDEYALKTRFDQFGVRAQGAFPGVAGLTGNIEADEKSGLLILRSGPSALELPAVFPEPRLAFDSLAATARWKRHDGQLEAELQQASFAGADAMGSAAGRYRWTGQGPGEIDLTARLERAEGPAVWRYMPHVVGAETREWLRRGIVAGVASDVQLTLKGDLARFPFATPATPAGKGAAPRGGRARPEGQFLVTAKLTDGILDYVPGWPRIEGIDGELRFERAGMTVRAKSARLLGAGLSAVHAEIRDFAAADPLLNVKGAANGPTSEFLRYLDQTPLGEVLGHFYSDMRVQGDGRLDLQLDIPLAHAADAKVRGEYQFHANQIQPLTWLPPVQQVSGKLTFTEGGAEAREIGGQFMAAPLKLAVKTLAGHQVVVDMQGGATIPLLRRQFDWRLFDHLSGATSWRAELRVRPGERVDFGLDSGLQGVTSSLPEPFNKSAGTTTPLRVAYSMPLGAAEGDRQPEELRVAFGSAVNAQLFGRFRGAGSDIQRGAVAIGEALALPERGWQVGIASESFNLDFWRGLLPARPAAAGSGASLPLPRLQLRANRLQAGGREWHGVNFSGQPVSDGLQGSIEAQEMAGSFQWRESGPGRLQARLRYLQLPAETSGKGSAGADEATQQLPDLDVQAEQASIGNRRLGRLELQAGNSGPQWRIQRLQISNPDGEINATGHWQPGGNPRTSLDFKVAAHNLGGFLDRLGYPDTIRRGSATLEGKLSWAGAPNAFQVPSLAGEMELQAARGQFNKLEPGFGKLLGLLSLQNLPRRVTLDFRDVFSEGFAFDDIEGHLTVASGVLHTEELKVEGPAAKVLMRGDVDLKSETQNLRVAVLPEIGSTVALGAVMLANPVAGVATYLAQKLLRDPLNKAFAFEYQVTGSWVEPKVEKVGQLMSPGRGREPAPGKPGGAPAPSPAVPPAVPVNP